MTRGKGLAGALGLALLVASGARAHERPPIEIRAFKPVADAYVSAAQPSRNFGRTLSLRADGAPQATVYLRFRTKGEDVDSVTLLLHAEARGRGFQVRRVHDDEWRESRLTYRNAPRLSQRYASSKPVRAGRWCAVDVTSLVTEGDEDVGLAITTRSPLGVVFASREARDGPRLVVRTEGSGKGKGKRRIQGREPTP